jgi:hypothetical protein
MAQNFWELVFGVGKEITNQECKKKRQGKREPEACIEHLVRYNDEYYTIITDPSKKQVWKGDRIYLDEAFKEGGFVWDAIKSDICSD